MDSRPGSRASSKPSTAGSRQGRRRPRTGDEDKRKRDEARRKAEAEAAAEAARLAEEEAERARLEALRLARNEAHAHAIRPRLAEVPTAVHLLWKDLELTREAIHQARSGGVPEEASELRALLERLDADRQAVAERQRTESNRPMPGTVHGDQVPGSLLDDETALKCARSSSSKQRGWGGG